MDHVRPVGLAIVADVGHVEPLRLVEVELDRRELPGTFEGVEDMEVDLRPVEHGLPFHPGVREPPPLQGPHEGHLRLVPHRVAPDVVLPVLRIAHRQGNLVVTEPERPQDAKGQVQAPQDLVLDLVGAADDVGIVLGKPPHPQKPVQHARPLEPVHRPELGVADGQVAVGAGTGLVDRDVERAVHRFQVELLALDIHRRVHPVLVEIEVAGGLPQSGPSDVRARHELVASVVVLPLPKGLDLVADPRPFRVPQDEPRPDRFILDREEIELGAEDAVVPLPRLLPPLQVLGERLGGGKRGPVDAGQHVATGVAPPVGAGHVEERQMLGEPRCGEVGAAAEVEELPLAVERDPLVGDLREEFELVHLALLGEERFRLRAREPHPFDGEVLGDDLPHLRLDPGEIVAVHRLREPDVVVEPVVNGWADGELRPGVEPGHGVGEDVGGRVPQHLERCRVVQADRAGLACRGQRVPQVLELPVHEDRDGRLPPLLEDREEIASPDFDQLAARQNHGGHPTPPVRKRMSRTLPRPPFADNACPDYQVTVSRVTQSFV